MTKEQIKVALRVLGGSIVCLDELPVGPFVGDDEVGAPGPWFGVKFADGTVEGWGRNIGSVDILLIPKLNVDMLLNYIAQAPQGLISEDHNDC
jgi:hypothetical protein